MLNIEKQVCSAVCKGMSKTGGFGVPPFSCQRDNVYFAIDNIDRLIHDQSGKDQFHGTVIVINQKIFPGKQPMLQSVKLTKDVDYTYNVVEKM